MQGLHIAPPSCDPTHFEDVARRLFHWVVRVRDDRGDLTWESLTEREQMHWRRKARFIVVGPTNA